MTVGLEKLVQDIKNETSIWPIEKSKNTPEEDAAWDRVGARNKMSGNHVKSIFKVLSKKYEAEKLKPNTNWKLFEYLKFLDEKSEPDVEDEEEDGPDDADLEDDGEFVELLEVNEYDDSDDEDNESAASGSGQSSRNISLDEEQKHTQSKILNAESEVSSSQKSQIAQAVKNQQKVQTSTAPSPQQQIKQLKGIEVKKIVNTQTKRLLKNSNEQLLNKKINNPNQTLSVEAKLNEAVRNQAQYSNKQQRILSECLKRKLPSEEINKTGISSDNGHKENVVSPPPAKKQTKEFITPQGLKVERIVPQQKQTEPISSDGKIVQKITNDRKIKTFTNFVGKSAQQSSTIENETENISPEQQKLKSLIKTTEQNGCINEKMIIKQEILENVEQKNSELSSNESAEAVLPSFFRDLYNSKKYDCFGMYVASAMNRLPTHLASKLETKILQAIIEVNSLVSNDD